MPVATPPPAATAIKVLTHYWSLISLSHLLENESEIVVRQSCRCCNLQVWHLLLVVDDGRIEAGVVGTDQESLGGGGLGRGRRRCCPA